MYRGLEDVGTCGLYTSDGKRWGMQRAEEAWLRQKFSVDDHEEKTRASHAVWWRGDLDFDANQPCSSFTHFNFEKITMQALGRLRQGVSLGSIVRPCLNSPPII
jgi:hypothetical protein